MTIWRNEEKFWDGFETDWVRDILDGKKPLKNIIGAFWWDGAEEGHDYWEAVHDAPVLSAEARAKLEAYLAKAPTPPAD